MKQWVTKTAWPLLQRTVKAWNDDDCSRMAASLAYYAVFSIFPLILLLLSVLGYWLRLQGDTGTDVEKTLVDSIMQVFQTSPQVGVDNSSIRNALVEILKSLSQQAGTNAPIALITTFFAASGIFVQIDKSFDVIWDIQPKQGNFLYTIRSTVIERGKAFSLVLVIGLLLISSLVLSSVLQGLENLSKSFNLPGVGVGWQIFTFVLAFAVNVLIFFLLFFAMPKPKMRWRDVLPGAILTAALWEIGKIVLSLFLGGNKYTASTTVAAFIALLAWIYYASQIIFFGAEFCRVYTDWNQTRRAKLAPAIALPTPPDLPTTALPPALATSQQKATYAVGGTALGVVLGVVMSIVGTLVAIIQFIRTLRNGKA
ncbi:MULTISPECIES: YihY/virulence factor BrkB family protein [Herpetosiphon]|uniref:YihY/virulence factor BrkB family protein n=1 Tax=Herpetosiphon TaxID=64 RepID=UPI0019580EEB|nr:YihY/virulence factor BrkB family protein [Herpetosiphon giganteus]MBM7843017.1 membrane protein [Herpetosiphon giganteus]